MRKLLQTVLLLCLAFCTAVCIVSCDKNDKDDDEGKNSVTTTSKQSEPEKYTVSFSAEDETMGTVAGTVTNGKQVESGTSITLTATPKTGYSFDGWYKGDTKVSGDASYTFTMGTEGVTLVAKFKVNNYGLNYSSENENFGTVSGDKASGSDVAFGTSVTITATPKTGYNFDGWYIGDTKVSSDASYTFTMGTEGVTLVAKFKVNKYGLNYSSENENFGTVSGDKASGSDVAFGTSVTITATPKTGYSFDGWYIGDTKVSSDASYTFTMGTEGVTLVAKFKVNNYGLNYSSENENFGTVSGDKASGSDVAFGTSVTITATPKTGYNFDGWYIGDAKVSSDTSYTFTMGTEDVTLVARFTAQKRTVRFYDGYDLVHTEIVDYNTSVPLYVISKSYYNFIGWYTTPLFDTLYAGTEKVTEDINLYAKFEKAIVTHEVTFVNEDGSRIGGVQTIVDGEKILQFPAIPTKTGYNSLGWFYYDEATDKYIPVGSDFTVVSDVTIYARYAVKQISIKFYLENDFISENLWSESSVDYGSTAGRPTTPTKENYIFVKWVYADNTDAEFDFSVAVTDEDGIVLVAVWEVAPTKTHTVRFYDEKNGNLIDTQTIEDGGSATAPTLPGKIGYEFLAWSESLDGITEDKEIYATYTVKTFKVVFRDYDNSELSSQTVEYGKAASAPEINERAGYEFTGWSCSFDVITDDLTVTAKYEINKFTVKFMDGDDELYSQTVNYGTSATVPTTPTKAGYSFIGWYADKELTEAYDFKTAVTGNKVLYASFKVIEVNKYNVKFILPNGEIISEQTVVEGKSAIAPGDPQAEGMIFIGWDKEFSAVKEDLIITAKFKAKKYSVRFMTEDGKTLIKETEVEYGKSARNYAPTDIPKIANKEFAYWSGDIDCIKEDTEVCAVYVKEKRSVFFYTDGETPLEVIVEHGDCVNIPNTPSKAGCIFKYWRLEGSDTAFDFSTPITDKNGTKLYAEFEQIVGIYTVTFYAPDGTLYGNVQTVAEGRYAIEPAPYDDGEGEYIWCLDGTSVEFDFKNTEITGNIILRAVKIG